MKMGRLQAETMAEASIGLEAQLEWQLVANHYPPIPTKMIPVCVKAIDYANKGRWDKLISLPAGITYQSVHNSATAYEIVESLNLTPWIIESELD
jgi:hypothetical protein